MLLSMPSTPTTFSSLGSLRAKEAEHVAQQRTVRISPRRYSGESRCPRSDLLSIARWSAKALSSLEIGEKDFVFALCLELLEQVRLGNAQIRRGNRRQRFRILDVGSIHDHLAHGNVASPGFLRCCRESFRDAPGP